VFFVCPPLCIFTLSHLISFVNIFFIYYTHIVLPATPAFAGAFVLQSILPKKSSHKPFWSMAALTAKSFSHRLP